VLQVIYIKEGTGKLETNATVAVEITDAIEFNIQNYKTFKEIPLGVLVKLPFSTYIIDLIGYIFSLIRIPKISLEKVWIN
jgi:hypothetical protein